MCVSCRRAVPHFDIEDTFHVMFELFHLFRCISADGISVDLVVHEVHRSRANHLTKTFAIAEDASHREI